MRLNIGIQHRGGEFHKDFFSNDDPILTFDLFTARSKLCSHIYLDGESIDETFANEFLKTYS